MLCCVWILCKQHVIFIQEGVYFNLTDVLILSRILTLYIIYTVYITFIIYIYIYYTYIICDIYIYIHAGIQTNLPSIMLNVEGNAVKGSLIISHIYKFSALFYLHVSSAQ